MIILKKFLFFLKVMNWNGLSLSKIRF